MMNARYKRNSVFEIFGFTSYSRSTLEDIRCFDVYCRSALAIAPEWQHPSMANYARFVVIAIIIGIVCGEESSELEDVDKNIFLSLPYGRGLDSELQLAKLLLMAPRFCHPKRNSELINSLLGLPKNMHNVGKRK